LVRRLWLTCLLTAACCATATVATPAGAATPTLRWSAPQLIESQPPFANSPGLVDIACPTARFCLSGTNGAPSSTSGIEVSRNPTGGTAAWRFERIPQRGFPAGPLATSCASLRLCVLLMGSGGTAPFAVTSAAPDRGTGNWRAKPAPAGMTSLACPTWKLCIGIAGSSIEVTQHPRAGASAWHAVAFNGGLYQLSAVACHGAHLCIAVGLRGHAGAVAVSTDPTGGRRAWHVSELLRGHLTTADTIAAACTSKHACVITDDLGDVIAAANPAAARPRWRATFVPGAGGSVSCLSPSFCLSANSVAVATSHNPAGGKTAWSTTRWPAQQRGEPELACASGRLCVAAGPGNQVLTSTAPARGGSAFTTTDLDQGDTPLLAIACPSAGLCLATGGDNRLLRSNAPASGPSAWSPVQSTLDGQIPDELSCSSPAFCAGMAGTRVLTGDPAQTPVTWTVGPAVNVAGVSCASEALCVAFDSNGDVITTTDPAGGGAAWTTTQLPTTIECGEHDICVHTPLDNISCPSVSFCAALDEDGNYWASSDPAGGAGAWTKTPLPRMQSALSVPSQLDCPSASLCVVVSATRVLTTSDPADTTPAWSTVALPPNTSTPVITAVDGLSCAGADLCVAVNTNGWAMWGDPTTGNPWSATQLGGPASLTAVSCAPSGLCVAGDSAGRIFTAQPS
jgi:hypothetical protein